MTWANAEVRLRAKARILTFELQLCKTRPSIRQDPPAGPDAPIHHQVVEA